jgi:ubiquinone/menaquinone biosynthesis C-methylase UbiE
MSYLDRVPEPEVMDKMSEAIAYDLMDFRVVNADFVAKSIELNAGGKILDVGTGTGRIPILLAQELLTRNNRDFHIIAIDLAQSMLQIAQQHLLTAELESYISFQLVDAKQMPYPDHCFDMIISNSIVHHLSDPQPFFRELCRLLKPTGGVLIRDLIRPQTIIELEYLVSTYAGDCDGEQQKLFRDSLRASYTVPEIKTLFQQVNIPRIHIYQSSDRHWTAERARL